MKASPRPEKCKLIMTVGLPYSGKSTWARQQNLPIVSPDAIRLALHGQRYIAEAEAFVWAITKIMVNALFEVGHYAVILDATNTTRKRREEWISSDYDLVINRVCTTKEECIERAMHVNDQEIIPVIERMAAEFEEPEVYFSPAEVKE